MICGGSAESDAIDHIHRTQPPINFSSDVLERERQRIVAIEVDERLRSWAADPHGGSAWT